MYSQFAETERYTLSVLKQQGWSIRSIARSLGRSPSTISRELARNRTKTAKGWTYCVSKAQEQRNGRLRRSRRVRHHSPSVYEWIERQLTTEQWSPEQLCDALQRQGVRLSPMTIYRYLWRDHRQGGTLRQHLRQGLKRRRKRTPGVEKRGRLQGKPMIDERPGEVEDRQEVGHWEGDTVMGAAGELPCLLTLVERSTGFGIVRMLPNRTVEAVNRVVVEVIKNSGLPFKTITWDNGTEFHGYREIEARTAVSSYFARPHHPWERGSNENFNGLLRQYIRKGSSMYFVSPKQCRLIEDKLNRRPRKRYGYRTPAQELQLKSGVLRFEC